MHRSLLCTCVLLVFLAVVGCGSDGPVTSEDYGNLLNSPGGLIVLEEEHQTGWGRPECFSCHEIRNIHTVNRTGIPDFDLGAVRDLVAAEGTASCPDCHGDNGVRP